MARHQASGRFGMGLALASTTMLLWGVLPIMLEGVLTTLDAVTITGFRFAFAAGVMFAWLRWRLALPQLRGFGQRRLGLLAVAVVFLAINYLTYLLGLERTNAATAQVLIQAAPLLLALGGIFVFREPFSRLQWLGLATLVVGMAGFFADQLRTLVEGIDVYVSGVAMIGLASVTWAIYGLAQKQLLLWLPSQAIILCLYAGGALIFMPASHPGQLLALDAAGWTWLLLSSANTLVAYGSFAAALEHWEASRVSAVLALTPLATLCFAWLAAGIWPELVDARTINAGAFIAAGVVVMGSLLVALGRTPETPE